MYTEIENEHENKVTAQKPNQLTLAGRFYYC